MALMYPKIMSKFMASIMQVDIGSGVLVEEGTLEALQSNCPGAAAKFARGLLRIVFAPKSCGAGQCWQAVQCEEGWHAQGGTRSYTAASCN